MLEIIPSILTNDPNELKEKLERCEGLVDRVHIDIIDGIFAKNKTIDPSALSDLETELKLDFHLMVKEPVNWVEKCVRGGADRIIGQIEYMRDQVEFVGKVQEVGASIGLAVDLKTDIGKLDPVILTNLDVVWVMSVAAGFGGQKFDERALNKIKRLDEIRARDDTPYRICDDGGITLDRIDDARRAGVDEVAIGRRIFKGNLKGNIKMFQRAAYLIR
jgi:ribulose-phosphate 3-epimerase